MKAAFQSDVSIMDISIKWGFNCVTKKKKNLLEHPAIQFVKNQRWWSMNWTLQLLWRKFMSQSRRRDGGLWPTTYQIYIHVYTEQQCYQLHVLRFQHTPWRLNNVHLRAILLPSFDSSSSSLEDAAMSKQDLFRGCKHILSHIPRLFHIGRW